MANGNVYRHIALFRNIKMIISVHKFSPTYQQRPNFCEDLLVFLALIYNEKSMTNEELWQAVLAQVQLTTSPANFTTWF